MGIEVSDSQMAHLIRFAQMLIEWNRRINLTAITDPREVAVKHFLDAMAVLPHIPETGRLLDIGSGGGFPGLVIAIFRPDLSITSIDSVRKKISFQQQLIRILGLKESRALHARAESLPEKNENYDIIVSRALGSLDKFLNLGLPLLAEEGRMIAYKGVIESEQRDEIDALKSQHKDLSMDIHNYFLPLSDDRRSMVFIQRK
jgi:16S rRNA (guanine527-N7)-methyltransferase